MGVARLDGRKWGYSGLFNPTALESNWGRHYYSDYSNGVLTDTNMLESVGFEKPPVISDPNVFGFHYYREYADGVLTDTNMDQGVEFDGTPTIE